MTILTKEGNKKESVISKRTAELFSKEGSSYLPEEIGNFYYSYDNLEKHVGRELKNVTLQVRTLYGQTLANAIKIGKYLDYVQHHVLERGEWINWLIKEFEEPGYFTHHTGRNFINCYYLSLEYGGLEKLKPMTLSTLYNIARKGVSEEAKREVIERSEKGERLNKKQVQNIIAKHKKREKKVGDNTEKDSFAYGLPQSESELEDKCVPLFKMDDKSDLNEKLSECPFIFGDVIGIQFETPMNIPYILEICRAKGLTYYWTMVIDRANSYNQDFVFESCYEGIMVFYMGHIDLPSKKVKDYTRDLEEAKKELSKLC